MSKELALSYFNKGLNSSKTEEKLFCFYDAFLVFYGREEGVAKAAESCNVSEDFLRKAVNYANADSDSEKALISDEQLKKMQEKLKDILCSQS